MLAVAVSFLAALYLLGPDLLSRSILGFVAPRKSAPSNRGEEVTRAVLWAAIPLALAVLWVWRRGVLGRWGRWSAIDNVYACLSSTCSGADRTNLWGSLRGFIGMNYSILWREYLLVVIGSVIFCFLIAKYGSLRRHLHRPFYREALAFLVTPLIADWHVWLSNMLLPDVGLSLVADALTKNGTLYQGTVGKRILGNDGSLQTLTLVAPRRFLREDYKAATENGKTADREAFWRPIPGNVFIVMGSDIINLNIFYVRETTKIAAREMTVEDKDRIRKITELIRPGGGGVKAEAQSVAVAQAAEIEKGGELG